MAPLIRKSIPKTSQGEWFIPFAFFIACSARKEAKYFLGWREFRGCFDRESYFFCLKIKKVLEKISELYLNRIWGGMNLD